MPDTCGLTSRPPFAYYDQRTSSWRTSQLTFPWGSMSSSLTLPRWGTTHRGALYEQPTPALLMSGPGCSCSRISWTLLPTPVVMDMGAYRSIPEWEAWTSRLQSVHRNGNGHGPSLHVEMMRLFPTPTGEVAHLLPSAAITRRQTPLPGRSTARRLPGGRRFSAAPPPGQLSLDALPPG